MGEAMRRVVITGSGTINALGHDIAETKAGLQAGRTAIGVLDIRDSDRLTIKIGAQVKGFDPAAHFTRKQLSFCDPVTQFAMIAAREAVAQAGVCFDGDAAERAGVVLGTSGGGLQTIDDNYRAVYEEQKNRAHPFTVPRLMHSAGASHISMEHGIKGPVYSVSSACASSNHAFAQAMMLIRSGMADVMLAGGAEAMLCFGGIKAWEGLRVLSPDGCRPFSADRNGMVQGEGAAIFVFEDYEHARARGATILAEVVGVGMTADAEDIVQPSADGAARAMRLALADGGLAPSDIDYINAHGTGTRLNDKTESAAIAAVFGASTPPVSSTKSMHGHVVGATGAMEMIAVLMALTDGVIAPTAGFTEADPECPLDVVPNMAREKMVNAVLSNAFAFGGLNAVIAVKRAP